MKLSSLCEYNKITIQCHDNPDADALASGYGLYCYFQSKGIETRLVYSGRYEIQKSNLRLMVEHLEIPVEYIPVGRGETLETEGLLITVDCQYGAGNVTGLSARDVVIIDHHQQDEELPPNSIISPNLGSCATLVWKLLREAGFEIKDEKLGTALYYGLYTDTNQFSELYNPLDMDMREAVPVDNALITLFRNSNLSLKELEIAGIAMIRYSYNDDYEFAVIKAQPCDPNILGLISDFLLQVDAIKTCVVFNEVNDGYKFSVRSCVKEVNANELAAFLAEGIGSGGGHLVKAGGFISLKLYEEKYPTLHTEGYFNNRMMEYFDSFDIIDTASYEIDTQNMDLYAKRKVPVAYVKADEILPVGTPITIRTLEGDIDLTVEESLYIMIGVKGEVYPKNKDKFMESYQLLDDTHDRTEYIHSTEYPPVIKNRENGQDMQLVDYAHGCVPMGNRQVYARPLERGVKLFTAWDKNKYMLGKPGDFLIAKYEDKHDIYVIEKDLFQVAYYKL